jgi:N-acetylmuramoyl-L-alanine amidase
MRHKIVLIQRIFATISVFLVLLIGLLTGQSVGLFPADLRDFVSAGIFQADSPKIALISGHAGYDSGAVCTNASGAVLLTEAEINARVAEMVAQRLQRSKFTVVILEEYDEQLNELKADVLLSIHADSCIELSGYKAAHRLVSPIPAIEAQLLSCIDEHYAAHTGLRPHPNTITHNMTSYHAFRRMHPETPAAILELGFLGGDGILLTQHTEQVADGVAASLRCFIEKQSEIAATD